jgi:outer membrane lipoprotein-sorting protein
MHFVFKVLVLLYNAMLMKVFSIILMLGIALQSHAQLIQDADALDLVKKLEAKYNTYSSIEAAFTIRIDIPEEDPILQEGKVIQQGDRYFMETEAQSIYSDGNSMWLHLKSDNEVQINDVDEDEASVMNLSPKGILAMFDENSYEYAITQKEGNIHHVEFKPLDKDSDFSKLRVAIDTKNETLIDTKIFYKDGIKYTMSVGEVTPNGTYQDDLFVFNADKYPGVYVEDLRID